MSATSAKNTGASAATPRRPSGLAPACLVAAAAALLGPGRAGAAPPRAAVQLEYRRAPGAHGCPDEGLLREEMARQLGYDPVDPEAALRAKALVFRGPDREMHATMDLHDAAGAVTWSRHLVAYNEDCRELVMNMALSLRVALDPSLQAQLAPAPAPPPLPPRRPETAAEAPARRPRPRLSVGLAGSAMFGVLQDTTPGTTLHVALRYPHLSLGLEAHVQWPAVLHVNSDAKISTWLAAVSAVPCSQGRYVFACAFASIGALKSDTVNIDVDDNPALWLATGPRLGIEIPVSDRVAVQFYGDLVLRITEFNLRVGEEILWAPPSFGGLVGVRLAADLSPRREEPARRALLAPGAGGPR